MGCFIAWQLAFKGAQVRDDKPWTEEEEEEGFRRHEQSVDLHPQEHRLFFQFQQIFCFGWHLIDTKQQTNENINKTTQKKSNQATQQIP